MAQHGRPARAAFLYSRALSAEPSRWQIVLPLGGLLHRLGRAAEARRIARRCRSACSRPSRGLDGVLGRFILSLCLGDFDGACAAGEKLLGLTREAAVIRGLSAPAIFEVDGESDSGRLYRKNLLRRLKASARRAPDSLWMEFFIRTIGKSLGLPASAAGTRNFLQRLDAAPGRYDWMRFSVGRQMLGDGDALRAIVQFRRAAVFSKPDDWRCHGYIAEALLIAGNFPASQASFSRAEAAALSVEKSDARAWRGEALLWSGRYRQALAVLSESVCAEARYGRAWRGGALLKLGRPKEALKELNAALIDRPQDAEAMLWRCETLLALGRVKDAERDVERAGRCSNDDLFQKVLTASVLTARGDKAGAVEAVRQLPSDVVIFVCTRCGLPNPPAPDDFPRFLKSLLRLSRGVRLGGYRSRLWMNH
jgi:tetratricopeptide (TPR) repeat protein